jgi:hypothetical protein
MPSYLRTEPFEVSGRRRGLYRVGAVKLKDIGSRVKIQDVVYCWRQETPYSPDSSFHEIIREQTIKTLAARTD